MPFRDSWNRVFYHTDILTCCIKFTFFKRHAIKHKSKGHNWSKLYDLLSTSILPMIAPMIAVHGCPSRKRIGLPAIVYILLIRYLMFLVSGAKPEKLGLKPIPIWYLKASQGRRILKALGLPRSARYLRNILDFPEPHNTAEPRKSI